MQGIFLKKIRGAFGKGLTNQDRMCRFGHSSDTGIFGRAATYKYYFLDSFAGILP